MVSSRANQQKVRTGDDGGVDYELLNAQERKRLAEQKQLGSAFDITQRVFTSFGSGNVFDYGYADSAAMSEMLKRDGKARGIEQVLTLPIRAAEWSITGENSDLAMEAIPDIGLTIGQMTSAVVYRKAYFEKEWELDGTNVRYKALHFRPAIGCATAYDPQNGNVMGFKQRRNILLGKYAPTQQQTLSVSNKQNSDGDLTNVFIPASRAFIYIHGLHREPLLGVSDMEVCQWAYETRQKILFLWFQFLENQSLPSVVAYGNSQPEADIIAAKFAELKASGVIGVPKPNDGGAAFEVINTSGQGGMQFQEAITYLEMLMTHSVLAGFLDLTTATRNVGTYALSKDSSGFFLNSRQGVADEMAQAFTRRVIKPLIVYNLGPDAKIPNLNIGPIGRDETERALTLLTSLAVAPALNIPMGFVEALANECARYLGLDTGLVSSMLNGYGAQREAQAESVRNIAAHPPQPPAGAPPGVAGLHVPGGRPNGSLRTPQGAVTANPTNPAAIAAAVDFATELLSRTKAGEDPNAVALELVKWDPLAHPKWPLGSSNGKGGQFMTNGEIAEKAKAASTPTPKILMTENQKAHLAHVASGKVGALGAQNYVKWLGGNPESTFTNAEKSKIADAHKYVQENAKYDHLIPAKVISMDGPVLSGPGKGHMTTGGKPGTHLIAPAEQQYLEKFFKDIEYTPAETKQYIGWLQDPSSVTDHQQMQLVGDMHANIKGVPTLSAWINAIPVPPITLPGNTTVKEAKPKAVGPKFPPGTMSDLQKENAINFLKTEGFNEPQAKTYVAWTLDPKGVESASWASPGLIAGLKSMHDAAATDTHNVPLWVSKLSEPGTNGFKVEPPKKAGPKPMLGAEWDGFTKKQNNIFKEVASNLFGTSQSQLTNDGDYLDYLDNLDKGITADGNHFAILDMMNQYGVPSSELPDSFTNPKFNDHKAKHPALTANQAGNIISTLMSNGFSIQQASLFGKWISDQQGVEASASAADKANIRSMLDAMNYVSSSFVPSWVKQLTPPKAEPTSRDTAREIMGRGSIISEGRIGDKYTKQHEVQGTLTPAEYSLDAAAVRDSTNKTFGAWIKENGLTRFGGVSDDHAAILAKVALNDQIFQRLKDDKPFDDYLKNSQNLRSSLPYGSGGADPNIENEVRRAWDAAYPSGNAVVDPKTEKKAIAEYNKRFAALHVALQTEYQTYLKVKETYAWNSDEVRAANRGIDRVSALLDKLSYDFRSNVTNGRTYEKPQDYSASLFAQYYDKVQESVANPFKDNPTSLHDWFDHNGPLDPKDLGVKYISPTYPEGKSSAEALRELAKRAMIKGSIDQWARSSGDHEPEAVAMQIAAANMFNTGDLQSLKNTNPGNDWSKAMTIASEKAPALQAILSSMYENTQQMFKDRNITELTLVRGMDAANEEWAQRDGSPEMKNNNGKDYALLNMQLNPLTSWSADVSISKGFTTGGYGTKNEPVIFTAKVPTSRIIGSALTGFGCLNEQEFVVIGTSGQIGMTWEKSSGY